MKVRDLSDNRLSQKVYDIEPHTGAESVEMNRKKENSADFGACRIFERTSQQLVGTWSAVGTLQKRRGGTVRIKGNGRTKVDI